MRKQYIVDLTPDERTQLVALTRKGKASARQVTRAHVLGDALTPVPPRPGRAARYDYEYKRGGTQSLFIVFCPARGWRL